MARVLIVGCGCRGRGLAEALVERGHAVRGTTRDESNHEAIAAAGAEPVTADPDRLGTVLPQLDGVSVLCWLMGSAVGEPETVAALHGPRLESMLETLVDTHVRGVVYEAGGSVASALLEDGAAVVRSAGDTFRMPAEVVAHDPGDSEGWTREMALGVDRVLAG